MDWLKVPPVQKERRLANNISVTPSGHMTPSTGSLKHHEKVILALILATRSLQRASSHTFCSHHPRPVLGQDLRVQRGRRVGQESTDESVANPWRKGLETKFAGLDQQLFPRHRANDRDTMCGRESCSDHTAACVARAGTFNLHVLVRRAPRGGGSHSA